jgi:hypothetical protein
LWKNHPQSHLKPKAAAFRFEKKGRMQTVLMACPSGCIASAQKKIFDLLMVAIALTNRNMSVRFCPLINPLPWFDLHFSIVNLHVISTQII